MGESMVPVSLGRLQARSLGTQPLLVSKRPPADFTTIKEAVAAAQPGARILVRPGTYREAILLDKTIELIGDVEPRAEPSWWGRLRAPGKVIVETRGGVCLRIVGGSPVVRNITFRQTDEDAALHVAAGDPIVEFCELQSATGLTVVIGGRGANPTLRDNQIREGGAAAVLIHSGAGGLIEGNEITGTAAIGVRIADAGTHPTVRGNRIRDKQMAAIWVGEGATGLIEGNEIDSPDALAVLVAPGARPTVRDNGKLAANGGKTGERGPAAAAAVEASGITETLSGSASPRQPAEPPVPEEPPTAALYTEVEAVAEAEAAAEAAAEPVLEGEAAAEAAAEIEAVGEVQAAAQVEAVAEVETVPEAEAVARVEADVVPAVEAAPEVEAVAEVEGVAEARAGPVLEAEAVAASPSVPPEEPLETEPGEGEPMSSGLEIGGLVDQVIVERKERQVEMTAVEQENVLEEQVDELADAAWYTLDLLGQLDSTSFASGGAAPAIEVLLGALIKAGRPYRARDALVAAVHRSLVARGEALSCADHAPDLHRASCPPFSDALLSTLEGFGWQLVRSPSASGPRLTSEAAPQRQTKGEPAGYAGAPQVGQPAEPVVVGSIGFRVGGPEPEAEAEAEPEGSAEEAAAGAIRVYASGEEEEESRPMEATTGY